MSQVDPRFLQARKQASLRHKRKAGGGGRGASAVLWAVLVVLVLGALGGGGWFVWQAGMLERLTARDGAPAIDTPAPEADIATDSLPLELEPVAVAASPAPHSDPVEDDSSAIRGSIDLPGDPLLLNVGATGSGAAATRLPRPDALPAARGQGAVVKIQSALLEAGERLSLSLPTSPEDFAIFQAQRQRLMQAARAPVEPPVIPETGPLPRPRTVAEARALVGNGADAGGRLGADARALVPTHARQRPFVDSFLKLSRSTSLAEMLQSEGLSSSEAEAVAQIASDMFDVVTLEPGQVLALRQSSAPGGGNAFAQLAIYDGTRYLGALGRGDGTGLFHDPDAMDIDIAADPWLRQDLPALLEGTARSAATSTSTPRVMDALYSSALRHGLSPGLVGQVIMLLAQTHKLDQDATPDDRLTLIYSSTPGAPEDDSATSELDQILYVALHSGGETALRCYVHRPGPNRAPACYGPTRGSGPAASTGSSGARAPSGDTQSLTGGDAVEHLVNRIIQIESAGRADARNPLSTATGLGQFIESTWLRMMRTYRPDLSATLSRSEQLDLRTDPDISREMVLNLAREGESFLRARGHEITAGRLYLAHFLGMDGAHTALSAPPHADLLELFGPGVINANPFLRGKDAGYVVEWAERRMRGASGRIAVIREPDGLAEFRQIIDSLLEET